jgi:Fur family ferric uptake transcriptional regulator
MTHDPHAEPLEFTDVEEIGAWLRQRGQRLTAARRAILEALSAAEGPVSAEYIAEGLGGKVGRSEVTSVYRNLNALGELGIVHHVHIGHGPGLYALSSGEGQAYLACERCHRVTAVPDDELDAVRGEIRDRFGYEARFTHFAILGLCPDCSGARGPGAGSEAGHSHEH